MKDGKKPDNDHGKYPKKAKKKKDNADIYLKYYTSKEQD